MAKGKYETVIGLEVHVQLATDTKVFCGCSTKFGAEPNSHVCPVCLGQPGVLPVLNRKAFEFAIKVALAFGFEIQKIVKFDRKNYYYPDLPKNYQISQFDMPIAYNGSINIIDDKGEDKTINITRAHLEEDAGKLIHDRDPNLSYVDLNRTGTPLLEIVSEPEISTPQEAYEYLTNLKQTIKYLGVSDCNMEEGSLRCDANISLRPEGEKKLGSKVEIKNLNSFKAVRDALEYEQERQKDLLDEGERIKQETRLWDDNRNITLSMRSKEESHDYRYFPDPDLVPFEIEAGTIETIEKTMPELPAVRRERFISEHGLSGADAEILISEKGIADLFENVNGELKDPQAACNWIKGEVLMHVKEKGTAVEGLNIEPKALAVIISMAQKGVISGLSAKEVLSEYIETGKEPEKIVKDKGLEQVSDEGALEEAVNKVISNNEKSVNDYKGGKTNALSFLVGQVMKETKGKANPKLVGDMLKSKLS